MRSVIAETLARRATLAVIVMALALAPASCHRVPAGPVELDPAELESFVDAFFAKEMEERHIPGVTFIFVQDGDVLLAKGYGSADLEAGLPVDPLASVVRIGSVSKLFVATAVMQLVERGQVNLETDVNRYLTTLRLEDTYPQPVTLAHLLTHTGGFEDPPYASNTDPALVGPMAGYLAAHMPPRTSPPGGVFRYSNHGYALAALVVEQVSGQPFEQYVEENIFRPLAMGQTRYLVAPPLPEGLAAGYLYEGGRQVRQPVDWDSDWPGGSAVSTAADMARFMLAHLQEGCHQGTCILQPATLARMHERQGATPYKGQAVTYGFAEATVRGQRLIGHSGAIRGFGSILTLMPEHHLGYFFSFNSECLGTTACGIVGAFRQQFIRRFFPSGPFGLLR